MPLTLLLFGVALSLVLALLAVPGSRFRAFPAVFYASIMVVAAAMLMVTLQFMLGTHTEPLAHVLPFGLPWLGVHLRIDTLSAFFLLIVNGGVCLASLYAIGYGRHEDAPARVLPFYALFVAGMNLVLLADDAFTFLVCWEFMSLASWALVVSHHRRAENVGAGLVYLVMASIGTMALLLAFGILAGSNGGYGFTEIRALDPNAKISALVLVLALIGAGSKAGLYPLHAWLPLAHPAAPSHVSALMSGVMTKVAVYAFVRIVFDLLGDPAWWWSIAVIALGALSAVMGVLYALFQRDMKRILAYSTIENIGMVFCGLGLALAFKAEGMTNAAALALTAALLHAFNHALFKGLLFFGAGAVQSATGERDIERMGGLIHRLPYTAAAMLAGAMAIAALPPFNGFVSEWLTFQAILLSPQLPSWGLRLVIPAAGALLALSAALAAACYIRFYGAAFLGRPRASRATAPREVDRFSLAAMAIAAAACLVVGILPGLFIDALAPVVQSVVGARMPRQLGIEWLSIVPVGESRSSYNGLLLFLFMVISASLAASVIHRFASDRMRRAPAWDCGFPNADPATQYSADSLAQPVRRVFGTLLFRARETVEMPSPGDLRPARHSVVIHDLAWDVLYIGVARAVTKVADYLNRVQFLTIRQFLSLVFGALVLLLLVLALWP